MKRMEKEEKEEEKGDHSDISFWHACMQVSNSKTTRSPRFVRIKTLIALTSYIGATLPAS